jgi:hypothetical protein
MARSFTPCSNQAPQVHFIEKVMATHLSKNRSAYLSRWLDAKHAVPPYHKLARSLRQVRRERHLHPPPRDPAGAVHFPRQEQPRVDAVGPRNPERGADPAPRRPRHGVPGVALHHVHDLVGHHHDAVVPVGQLLELRGYLEEERGPALEVGGGGVEVGAEEGGDGVEEDEADGEAVRGAAGVGEQALGAGEEGEEVGGGVRGGDEDVVEDIRAGFGGEAAEAVKGEGEVGVEKEGGGGERGLGREEGELEAQLGLAGGGLSGDLGDGGGGEAAGEKAVEEGAAEGELGGAARREEEERVLWAGLALAVGGRGGGSRGPRRWRPHRRRASPPKGIGVSLGIWF